MDVCKDVEEVFKNQRVPANLNAINICLIPKGEFPKHVTEYLPINCSNFGYKVIANVMVNIIRDVMGVIVFEE